VAGRIALCDAGKLNVLESAGMRLILKMSPLTGVTATVPRGVEISVDSPEVEMPPPVGIVAASALLSISVPADSMVKVLKVFIVSIVMQGFIP
jgi:hypothetical protein